MFKNTQKIFKVSQRLKNQSDFFFETTKLQISIQVSRLDFLLILEKKHPKICFSHNRLTASFHEAFLPFPSQVVPALKSKCIKSPQKLKHIAPGCDTPL